MSHYQGQQILAQFTSQTKIVLAKHSSTRKVMPTCGVVIVFCSYLFLAFQNLNMTVLCYCFTSIYK
jgi:hypothetical protein